MNKNFIQKAKAFVTDSFRRHLVISIGIILIIIVFLSILGSFLYMRHYLNSKGSNNQQVEFTITSGESVRDIAKDLESKGLIEHDLLLVLYMKLTGQAGNLKAGEYLIAKDLSPIEIVDLITDGKVASRKIVIPEGWTIDQMGDYLDKQGIVSKEAFLAATKRSYDYWFLKGKPANISLEGFLFPDTYQVSVQTTADEIVQKMLDNFDSKTNGNLKLEMENSNMTPFQVVTLASIVEKEVSKPEDRKVVAGIFEKRLREEMPLQSDVTVKYFLKNDKMNLTNADTSIPSPYNTYINKGLPLAPVSNPGLDSISAVLNPTETDYYYFLSANGVNYYAKTLEEQEANRAKYLR